MEGRLEAFSWSKKRLKPKDREFTTALFALRAKQAGYSLDELSALSIGFVNEILIESNNDSYDYPEKADQGDIDSFFGG